jgi:hypothetical protein
MLKSMFARKKVLFLIAMIAWTAIFAPDAMAYLDPGTGSLIVQSVIAAIAAAGFGLKMYWGRVRGWIKKPRGQADESKKPPVGPV